MREPGKGASRAIRQHVERTNVALKRTLIIGLTLLGLALTACDRKQKALALPDPGSMRVEEISPVALPEAEKWRLDFEQWYAGAPTPSVEGLYIPKRVTLSLERKEVAEGQAACRQIWKKADAFTPPTDRLRIRLPGLITSFQYTLTFQARVDGEIPVVVDLFAREVTENGDEQFFLLPVPTVEVKPGGPFQTYTLSFAAGRCNEAYLSTACYTLPKGEKTALILDDLRLRLAGLAQTPPALKASPENLLENASFEAWIPGKPAPETCHLSPNRVTWVAFEKDQVAEGTAAVRQIWAGPDYSNAENERLGMQVSGLKAKTQYQFTAKGYCLGNSASGIEVYGRDAKETLVKLENYVLFFGEKTGEWQTQSLAFNSGEYTTLRFITRVTGKVESYPNQVIWDAWDLRPVNSKE